MQMTQLYVSLIHNNDSAIIQRSKGLVEISKWMKGSWLQLNKSKMEVMLVGRGKHAEELATTLASPTSK